LSTASVATGQLSLAIYARVRKTTTSQSWQQAAKF